MRAIILAAGEGTRLRPYTEHRPKAMVELAGEPLIRHQLRALETSGIRDVTVVTGYRAEAIEALGVATIRNSSYDSTNMVASLLCARDRLDGSDDVLVAYGDIVYEPRIAGAVAHNAYDLAIGVDLDWLRLWELRMADPLADAETLRMDATGCVTQLGKRPASLGEIEAQYMGLIRLSAAFAPELVSFHEALDPDASYDGKDLSNMYMTSLLQELVDAGHRLWAVPVRGGWLEIDSRSDLETYRRLADRGELARYWDPASVRDPAKGV